jgi:hypothetical protein
VGLTVKTPALRVGRGFTIKTPTLRVGKGFALLAGQAVVVLTLRAAAGTGKKALQRPVMSSINEAQLHIVLIGR